ncbi:flagellin [Planomonospora sp. ID82291]|uniref:flagellin N-terminal helical domain-containing protein n=1 Tax=Planomonospora sp. ID82291 TaxID=2738136 RepID=UPI0018C3583A|nr:flagellin [Planomonospora sp. ID82291]MBG0816700.1 flagellin [Planomonospora sp. ID82291]
MGLRINQNIGAMNAYRNLSVNDGAMAKSLEKLSSGYRINRAADDAAGLSISEGLRAQTGGLKVAVRNAQDGVSVVQTAEGALTETHSVLQRMRDLSVQAANGGSQDAKAQEAANKEFGQLKTELDRIAETTSFGTQKLLDGSYHDEYTSRTHAGIYATPVLAGGTPADQFDLTATIAGVQQTVTVTIPGVGMFPNDPQGYTNAVNQGIETALKDAGGVGDEVELTYEFVSNGLNPFDPNDDQYTFQVEGKNAFSIANSGGNVGVGIVDTSPSVPVTRSRPGGVFQVGADNAAEERIEVSIAAMDTGSLRLAATTLNSTGDAQRAIDALDGAIQEVSDQRARLGAYQNRFEHTLNNLNVAIENLSASESRIRDTDMAQEMVGFTRNQILSQAGTSMLAQANQAPQSVLKLLG